MMSEVKKSHIDGKDGSPMLSGISCFTHVFLTFIYLILIASFGRFSFLPLLVLASYPLFYVIAYDVDYAPIAGRILLISPFVVFLGLWNIFYDEGSVLFINLWVPLWILSFLTLVLKLFLSVSAVLILIATVGFTEISKVLAALGVPDAVVTQTVLLNRYIYLISEEIRNVMRARYLRGGRTDMASAGSICGAMLLRSISRAGRVSMALACRCYGGRLYGNSAIIKLSYSDKLFIVCWGIFFAVIRFGKFF